MKPQAESGGVGSHRVQVPPFSRMVLCFSFEVFLSHLED